MKQTRPTFRARLRLAAVAAILIPAAVTASPAWAHDSLSSTEPARDATVMTTPETVSLTLSEPPLDSQQMRSSVLTVTDGAGKTVSDPDVTVNGPTLSTKITAGGPGTYTVLWRAVSSDGHPIEGKYSFTVQPSAVQPSASAAPATPVAANQSATPAAADPEDSFRPPDNSNAPLALGIAAAVVAAAAGVAMVIRRKLRPTDT